MIKCMSSATFRADGVTAYGLIVVAMIATATTSYDLGTALADPGDCSCG